MDGSSSLTTKNDDFLKKHVGKVSFNNMDLAIEVNSFFKEFTSFLETLGLTFEPNENAKKIIDETSRPWIKDYSSLEMVNGCAQGSISVEEIIPGKKDFLDHKNNTTEFVYKASFKINKGFKLEEQIKKIEELGNKYLIKNPQKESYGATKDKKGHRIITKQGEITIHTYNHEKEQTIKIAYFPKTKLHNLQPFANFSKEVLLLAPNNKKLDNIINEEKLKPNEKYINPRIKKFMETNNIKYSVTHEKVH